jgi:hypothetical protein
MIVKADLFLAIGIVDVDHLPRLAALELEDRLVSLRQERQEPAVDRAFDREGAGIVPGEDLGGLGPLGGGHGPAPVLRRDDDVPGEKALRSADVERIDLGLEPVPLVEEVQLVLFVGAARRELDPAPADDDQARLHVGQVVEKDRGVAEGEADVNVLDLDLPGPDSPVRGDAQLIEPGQRPGDPEARHGPAAAPGRQGQHPTLEDRGIVVLEKGLDKSISDAVGGVLDAGQPQDDAGHLEVVEEGVDPALLGLPPGLVKGPKIRGEVPLLQVRLQPRDEGRRGFPARSLGRLLRGGRDGAEENERTEDAEDRFLHRWPPL